MRLIRFRVWKMKTTRLIRCSTDTEAQLDGSPPSSSTFLVDGERGRISGYVSEGCNATPYVRERNSGCVFRRARSMPTAPGMWIRRLRLQVAICISNWGTHSAPKGREAGRTGERREQEEGPEREGREKGTS